MNRNNSFHEHAESKNIFVVYYKCITGAWDAAGRPYFSAEELDGRTDIFGLIGQLNEWLKELGDDFEKENEI